MLFLGDDDIFVNPFQLEKFLDSVSDEAEAHIWGQETIGQPRVKAANQFSERYSDPIWYGNIYPNYVSGGGFIMNWNAAKNIQKQIPLNPVSPIDDAFIGICLKRAGLSNNSRILNILN